MSRLLEINPSEILAAISKHHGLRSLVPHRSFYDARRKISLDKLALSLRAHASLSLLSSRSTTMDGRRGGTGELAVYSIIVIYFSNTNSSAASPLRIPESHTRVRERERGRIRESLSTPRLLFPFHSFHPCLHASQRNGQSSMNSRSFNRASRLKFSRFWKRKEGRKESLKGEKKPLEEEEKKKGSKNDRYIYIHIHTLHRVFFRLDPRLNNSGTKFP